MLLWCRLAEDLVKNADSESEGLEFYLRLYISHKLSDDIDNAGLWTTV